MLERPAERSALQSQLPSFDRLVLLGDLVELRQGPLERVLDMALPVLRGLGQALHRGQEVVIVPGNHDHALLGPRRTRRPPRGLESAVNWQAGEPLAALSHALRGAHVRACYPGAWLREDVYATHGHYLDRHITVPLLERLGAATAALLLGDPPPQGQAQAAIEHYEAVLAPMYALIDAVAQRGLSTGLGMQARVWRSLESGRRQGGWRQRSAGLLLPGAVGLLNRIGLGPLKADLSSAELRRAGLRAFDEVLRRLAPGAEHVIFGHTHRAGPLPGDDRSEWVSTTGASLVNSGSWVQSPELIGPRPHMSPYRPGFAVVVADKSAPEVVNLLDP